MVNMQGFGPGPSLAPQHMALIPPEKLVEIEQQYAKELSALWANPTGTPITDRRFRADAWQTLGIRPQLTFIYLTLAIY